MSETAFATNEAAMLEPLAIEPMQYGAFTYTVGASETKWCVNSWATQIGPNGGRFDVRDPRQPMPLRNVTVTGLQSTSTGVFIDPSLATYADPKATVFARMAGIPELDTKVIGFGSSDTYKPFMPGPYGSILVGYSFHDTTWLVARGPQGSSAGGWNLWDEIGDAAADDLRVGHRLYVPVSKNVMSGISRGVAGGPDAVQAAIAFVNVPSDWGAVADPNTYTFRDDFLGSSLDTTTTWSRTEAASGNIAIDGTMAALRVKGSGAWGANGIFSQTGFTRATGLKMQCDILVGTANPEMVVGFHDGAGTSYTDLAHGVHFTATGLQVWENGTSRGTVGSSFTATGLYRLRITINGAGATYEIQGGSQYQKVGSSSWTNITPATSSSATGTLHVGLAIQNAINCYIGDWKVWS